MTEWVEPSDPLADLEAAVELVKDAPWPAPCGSADHPHLVHPRAAGPSWCACCGCLVDVDAVGTGA